MKKYLFLIFVVGAVFCTSAQKKNKNQTVEIKTNTYCNHCKVCETCGQRMEAELPYTKGINLATYNEESMSITVIYKEKKITLEAIRQAISKLGFDADDVPADPIAYENLDNCCKK